MEEETIVGASGEIRLAASKTRGADFFLATASTLLQLGRARSVIAKLGARTKVSDFKDDLFMGLLCLED
jgi:hypothetical protein